MKALEGSVLFPMPLEQRFRGATQRLHRNEGDGTVDLYGHCARWCSTQDAFVLPNGKSGNTVEEHNDHPYCSGQIGTFIEAKAGSGERTYLTTELISWYSHGVYEAPAASITGSHIAIVVSSGDDHGDHAVVLLDPANARSLAAHLLAAADDLDGLRTVR